jgi:hypothetical protein
LDFFSLFPLLPHVQIRLPPLLSSLPSVKNSCLVIRPSRLRSEASAVAGKLRPTPRLRPDEMAGQVGAASQALGINYGAIIFWAFNPLKFGLRKRFFVTFVTFVWKSGPC